MKTDRSGENSQSPIVGHTKRLVLTHSVISNVGGHQIGTPQVRGRIRSVQVPAVYEEAEPCAYLSPSSVEVKLD
jgi:hypothetical protein